MSTVQTKRTTAKVCLFVLLCIVSIACVGFIFPRITEYIAVASSQWDDLPRVLSTQDINGNGVSDTEDIIQGARNEVDRRPAYRSAYYRGGYPPATEGVCSDLIWRAFQDSGYDLKAMVDADIRANVAAYPRVQGKPDPHIDFRRVPNLLVFFKRHGKSLTKEIIPNSRESLAQWQPGDIVTFTGPDHIAILSDRRNSQGIPFLLHNDGPVATESDSFERWAKRGITGHFRFPKE